MTKIENNILLISITLCWAASYIFIRNLPPDLSSYAYLTLTTGIAAVLMILIFWKKLFKLTAVLSLKGAALSVLLSLNLLAERKGIEGLSSAEASFLSALSIIMVPALLMLMRQKPGRNHVCAAVIILAGLCISSGFSLQGFLKPGVLYMLGACLCSAVYTIAADRFTKEEDTLLLCIMQMVFTAVTGLLLWYREDPAVFTGISYSREMLSNIFVLAFFTKAYAYIVLMYAQKYTDAISVTVIASTEPVITLFLAFILPSGYGGNQAVNARSVAGALVIVAGAVIAGLDFLPEKKGKDRRKRCRKN